MQFKQIGKLAEMSKNTRAFWKFWPSLRAKNDP